VDTLWIESMNSVMDDNKVLTLINSDRIEMSSTMSLLFEVRDLAVASPATVSRAGMVYMDQSNLGSGVFIQSWLDHYFKDSKLGNKSGGGSGAANTNKKAPEGAGGADAAGKL
jgi:dynein heavy chain